MTLRDYLATKLQEDGYDGLAGQGCGCDTGAGGGPMTLALTVLVAWLRL